MKILRIAGIVAAALSLGAIAVLNEQAVAAGQISAASELCSGVVDLGGGRLAYMVSSGYKLTPTSPWSGAIDVAISQNGTVVTRYHAPLAAVVFDSATEAHATGPLAGSPGKTLTLDMRAGADPGAGYDAGGASDVPVELAFKAGLVRLRQ